MSTLIVFATEMEAKDYKRLFPSAKNILITGMGMEAAQKHLAEVIDEYDAIINAGVVGALREDMPIGTKVNIKSVTHEETKETLVTDTTGFSLLSVMKPLYSTEQAADYELVDMEGFAIASLCNKKRKNLTFIKVVSDYCNAHSKRDIRERLPFLSEVLANHIIALNTSASLTGMYEAI